MATLELVQDLLIGVGQAQFYLRRDATHSDLLIPRRNPLLKIRAVHGEKAVIPGETRVVCKKNKMPQLLPLEVNNINKRPQNDSYGPKKENDKDEKGNCAALVASLSLSLVFWPEQQTNHLLSRPALAHGWLAVVVT